MTHVKVRTEADDIYDGYLTSSGYRELSRQMFLILEEYAPTLVPYSIDEGFLDLSTMDAHVWRNTTPAGYVQKIRSRIMRETRLPIRAAVKWAAHLR